MVQTARVQPNGVLVTRIDSSGLNPATVCGDGAEMSS